MKTKTKTNKLRLKDIAFSDAESKANFKKVKKGEVLNGFLPLVVINSNRPGIGKSLLARHLLKDCAKAPMADHLPKVKRDAERMLVRMSASIIDRGYLWLDDVPQRVLRSETILKLIEADVFVVVTGIYVRLSPDLERRALWIDLGERNPLF